MFRQRLVRGFWKFVILSSDILILFTSRCDISLAVYLLRKQVRRRAQYLGTQKTIRMNTSSDPLHRQHTQTVLRFMAYCFTDMRNFTAEQSLKLSES